RSLQVQALVSLCNAILMTIGLLILGVEHAVLLGVLTFFLCLIPVAGVLLSAVPVLVVALLQPGGGPGLALAVIGLIVLVRLLETFGLGPGMVGGLRELPRGLRVAILPVAEYFFGVWGVLLAAPVVVFLIQQVIFRTAADGPAEPGAVAGVDGASKA